MLFGFSGFSSMEITFLSLSNSTTPNGMLKAAEFVETVQSRQGMYISCIEEIAWRRGFISTDELYALGESLKVTDYGQYLMALAKEEIV